MTRKSGAAVMPTATATAAAAAAAGGTGSFDCASTEPTFDGRASAFSYRESTRATSTDVLVDVRRRLDEAHAAGRRFRTRVQLPIALFGTIMHAGGFALIIATAALGEWSYAYYAPPVLFASFFFSTGALLSSNHVLIEVAYAFCASMCAALATGHAALLAVDWRGYSLRACTAFNVGPVASCAFVAVEMAWTASSIVPPVVLLALMLCWRVHALPWRSLLDRLWFGAGCVFVAWGGCTLVYLCVAFGMGVATLTAGTAAQRRHWWALVVGVLTGIGMGGLCLRPHTRVRLQAFLASRSETVAAAAGVAALLGDEPPGIVLARGVALFRSIRVADLTEADLASNASSEHLYERSTPAHLHQVDAFVSHSWSDPPEAKWLELVKWRMAFVRRHGREPSVWLDKACLSQSNLSESLGSLPVFLAGCNSLLVLAGESYTRRLWCVVEIFVFLVMHPTGSVRNIALYPLGTDGGQALLGQLAHFDAERASCLLPEDQDRLLRTIEAGFGGFPKFNAEVGGILSRLLRERVEADAVGARGSNSSSLTRERVRRISTSALGMAAGRGSGRLSSGRLSSGALSSGRPTAMMSRLSGTL